MLNYLWAGMMIIGILWGAFHGQLPAVTEGALQSSKAVSYTHLDVYKRQSVSR